MTEDDLRTLLEPIYSALGAIMESITVLTLSVTALRERLDEAPTVTVVPEPVPSSTPSTDLSHLRNPRTGQFVGVYSMGRRWQARIGREIIGSFDSPEAAALARDRLKRERVATQPSAK